MSSWIVPTSCGVYLWGMWEKIRENDHLALYEGPSGKETPFELTLKGRNLLLAVGLTVESLSGKWETLTKDVAVCASRNYSDKETFDYVEQKVQTYFEKQENSRRKKLGLGNTQPTITFQDPENQEPQREPLRPQTQQDIEFEKKYNLKKEVVVGTFAVTMWNRLLPIPGTGYVSHNYFVFDSPIQSAPIIMKFVELESISRAEQGADVGLFSFCTHSDEYIFSVALWKRDEFSSMIDRLWKRGMENMGKSASFVKKETEKRRYNSENVSLSVDNSTGLSSKVGFRGQTKNENFCSLFQLPASETLIAEYSVSKLEYIAYVNKDSGKGRITAVANSGHLYISNHFVCFHTNTNTHQTADSLVFVIPLAEIISVVKGVSESPSLGETIFGKDIAKAMTAIGANLTNSEIIIRVCTSAFYIRLSHRKKVMAVLLALIDSAVQNKPKLPSHLRDIKQEQKHQFDESLFSNETQFRSHFLEEQQALLKKFQSYLFQIGNHAAMCRTARLRQLIRNGGVPLALKSQMWQFTSASFTHRMVHHEGYYQSLVAAQAHRWAIVDSAAQSKEESWTLLEQIERDLHRSLPGQAFYGNRKEETPGIESLRNVLRAYAAHNPAIGYCQAMNIISASLLLFVPEEDAFWLLCSIIQKVPDYYEKNMIGSIVDMNLFAELMEQRLPVLNNHLNEIYADLNLLALPWFLTLYVGYVPWEVTFRILDCFFAEGTNVLLQVGLAVMKLHQEKLLQIQDVVSAVDYIKNTTFDVESLMHIAFVEFALDHDTINTLKNIHRFKAIQSLTALNEKNVLSDLKRDTHFSDSELQILYQKYKQCLSVDSTHSCLDFHQFVSNFTSLLPWWPQFSEAEFKSLFKILNKNQNSVLSFAEYAQGIDIILRGSLLDQQQLVFLIFKDESSSLLLKKSFPQSISLLLSIRSFSKITQITEKTIEDASLRSLAPEYDPNVLGAYYDQAIQSIQAKESEEQIVGINCEQFVALCERIEDTEAQNELDKTLPQKTPDAD